MKETTALLPISTWGDGDPPDDGVIFFDYIRSLGLSSLCNLPRKVAAGPGCGRREGRKITGEFVNFSLASPSALPIISFPAPCRGTVRSTSACFFCPLISAEAHEAGNRRNDTMDSMQNRGAPKSARSSLLPEAIPIISIIRVNPQPFFIKHVHSRRPAHTHPPQGL